MEKREIFGVVLIVLGIVISLNSLNMTGHAVSDVSGEYLSFFGAAIFLLGVLLAVHDEGLVAVLTRPEEERKELKKLPYDRAKKIINNYLKHPNADYDQCISEVSSVLVRSEAPSHEGSLKDFQYWARTISRKYHRPAKDVEYAFSDFLHSYKRQVGRHGK